MGARNTKPGTRSNQDAAKRDARHDAGKPPLTRRSEGETLDKIRTTLELIRSTLNQSFGNAAPRSDDWVVLANLVEPSGSVNQDALGKVVMFLVNIQHETVVSSFNHLAKLPGDRYAAVSPPLYIDLLVMFVANFSGRNYPDGLAAISRTIGFFQQNPWFDHTTMPGLDPAVEKLTLEMINLDVTQVNDLIGLAGIRYLPLVCYRLRMLPFVSSDVSAVVPAVAAGRST